MPDVPPAPDAAAVPDTDPAAPTVPPGSGSASPPDAPRSEPGLWRNPAFVRLWTASTVSVFGSFVTRLALPFAAIEMLDAGPFEVALVRSIDLAAALLFGLVVGAWVDRLRRRPVMIWSDVGRALLLASIPIAAVGGWLSLPQLLLVAFLAAILATFFDAADNAYLPTVVGRERLVEANGALAASSSAAEFTGFGLSGFLVQLLTAPIAILIDAVSFLVSAVLLATIRRPEAPPPPKADRAPVLREIREGLAIIGRDPVIRAFALAQMAQSVLWGVFGGLWIVFAVDELGLGAAAVGIVAGAGGLAAFVGAATVTRVSRRFGIGPSAIGAMVVASVGMVLVPLAPAGAPLMAVAFLVGQQLLTDSGVMLFDVAETSVRQARVHDRALGRVAATVQVGSTGVQLAAALGAGLLAEIVGVRLVLFLAPLGALVAVAILWTSPVRRLRRIDEAVV